MTGQPLARALTELWFVVEGEDHPKSAIRVRNLIFDALQSPRPRGSLNLRMRRLPAREKTLREVRQWLDRTSVEAAARRGGGYWTLVIWRRALDAIMAGTKPHVAFNMARPGRRHNSGFSECENLAAYVEHRVRSGDAVGAVLRDVTAVMKNRTPDDGTIRSARRNIASLSDSDMAEMAATSRQVLGLP